LQRDQQTPEALDALLNNRPLIAFALSIISSIQDASVRQFFRPSKVTGEYIVIVVAPFTWWAGSRTRA